MCGKLFIIPRRKCTPQSAVDLVRALDFMRALDGFALNLQK